MFAVDAMHLAREIPAMIRMRTLLAGALVTTTIACTGPPVPEGPPDPLGDLREGWSQVVGGAGASCSDGSPYYFWFRPGDRERLAVHFQGGGMCWSGVNCSLDRRPTYDPAVTEDDDPGPLGGLMAFDEPGNPLAGYSHLFIPSCSADAHVGSAAVTYPVPAAGELPAGEITIRHLGYTNADFALDWINRRLETLSKVVITGVGTGAIGSAFHAYGISRRWPGTPAVQIGDAAGAYRAPAITALLQLWSTPDVTPGLPEYADSTTLDFQDFYIASERHAPELSTAQVNRADDETQRLFLTLLGVQPPDVSTLLEANLAEIRTAVPDFRSYTLPGDGHGVLYSPAFYAASVGRVTLRDWVADRIAGRPVESIGCERC